MPLCKELIFASPDIFGCPIYLMRQTPENNSVTVGIPSHSPRIMLVVPLLLLVSGLVRKYSDAYRSIIKIEVFAPIISCQY